MKRSDAEIEEGAYEELIGALLEVVHKRLPADMFANLVVQVMTMLAQAYEEGYELGFRVGTERASNGRLPNRRMH